MKIEHAHLASRRLGLAVTGGRVSPAPRETQLQWRSHLGGSHSQRFLPHNHWVPFRVTR